LRQANTNFFLRARLDSTNQLESIGEIRADAHSPKWPFYRDIFRFRAPTRNV
jgi:hypothetical protein